MYQDIPENTRLQEFCEEDTSTHIYLLIVILGTPLCYTWFTL